MNHKKFFEYYINKDLSSPILNGSVDKVRELIDVNPDAKAYLVQNTHFGPEQHQKWGQRWYAPLQYAVFENQIGIVQLLVGELGVNVDSVQTHTAVSSNPGAWTSLHLAVLKNNLPMVEALLECGADDSIGGNIKGTHFKDAKDLALKSGHTSMARCFK